MLSATQGVMLSPCVLAKENYLSLDQMDFESGISKEPLVRSFSNFKFKLR